MTTVIINSNPSSLSIFSSPDTIYEICIAINLNNTTVYLGRNTVLRFMGGSFTYGTIRGYQSSVETFDNQVVFTDVELVGEWYGAINDLLFSYVSTPNYSENKSFSSILASLLCFEKIDLYREKYYLEWKRVGIDTPQDIELDGHGAVWYISSTKGAQKPRDENTNPWGPTYDAFAFISYYYYVRGVFRVRNLIIEDNSETSGVQDFGEIINYSHGDPYNPDNPFPYHVVYTIFEGLASGLTEFDNVKYDGGGEFLNAYNQWVDAEKLVFKNCDLYTGGFAVEVLNLGNPGSLDEAIFDNCIIHNHLSRFVGALSFVSSAPTKHLTIVNSKICGYPGNLEVFGAETVIIDNTVFINHGLCSEYHPTIRNPKFYKCTNSQFYLTAENPPPVERPFCFMGDNVLVANNFFYLTHSLVFCDIKRLYLYDNAFATPEATEYVLVISESVLIGYYGNNSLSCPRIANYHVAPRVDTPYVLAQYQPFRVAFYHDIEVDTYHYGFDWSVGMKRMDELACPSIIIDSDGYAVGHSSPCTKTTGIINSTVTVSLVGRTVLVPLGTPESTLLSCDLGDSTTLTITASEVTVYRVFLDEELIADVPDNMFNAPLQEDVRLDITVTQINDYLDVFVYVNKALFSKCRSTKLAVFSPDELLFTPNSLTKIRMIRFVPGGIILDEPQSFNNWQE